MYPLLRLTENTISILLGPIGAVSNAGGWQYLLKFNIGESTRFNALLRVSLPVCRYHLLPSRLSTITMEANASLPRPICKAFVARRLFCPGAGKVLS